MAKKGLKFLLYAGALVAFAAILLPGYTKLQDLVAEKERLRGKIEELTVTIRDLELENERLQKDIYYIEKVARERMGTAREGEVVLEEKE